MLIAVAVSDVAGELVADGTELLDLLAHLATSPAVEDILLEICCAHDASLGHRAVRPFLDRLAQALAFIETDLPPTRERMVPL